MVLRAENVVLILEEVVVVAVMTHSPIGPVRAVLLMQIVRLLVPTYSKVLHEAIAHFRRALTQLDAVPVKDS